MRLLATACLLLLAAGCRWAQPPATEKIYMPHEAGLTLLYENPSLEGAARTEDRLQVRVAASKEGEEGLALKLTYTTLRGEMESVFFHRNGGVRLSRDGQPGIVFRPEGFPDKVTQWESNGTRFQVLGRAAADLHGLRLPEGMDRVGVWFESVTPAGQRQRVFLLPDIGEVEVLEWRGNAWVSTNRLVSRGFTDLPSFRQ